MGEEIPQAIKDLAAGVTGAVEVANRYWLALAAFSLFVLVPQPVESTTSNLHLPLGFPDVDAGWFSLLSVLGISVLLTAFSAAQTRLVRSTQLAHRILKDRRSKGTKCFGHDERDVFDAIRKPSLGQVSALALLVRGQHQFFIDQPNLTKWRLRLSSGLYLFFKLPALAVWLLLPSVALIFAAIRFINVGPPHLLAWLWPSVVWLLVSSAGLALLFAAWIEVSYLTAVTRRAWKNNDAFLEHNKRATPHESEGAK